MIILLLTIAFLVVSTIFVYRTAKDNGYNAILWTFISVAVFIGVQIFIGLTYAIVLAVLNWGHPIPAENYSGISTIVNFISIAAGVAGVLLILRHVNTLKDDETIDLPPPPTFKQED